jgi:hypothetical protein
VHVVPVHARGREGDKSVPIEASVKMVVDSANTGPESIFFCGGDSGVAQRGREKEKMRGFMGLTDRGSGKDQRGNVKARCDVLTWSDERSQIQALPRKQLAPASESDQRR